MRQRILTECVLMLEDECRGEDGECTIYCCVCLVFACFCSRWISTQPSFVYKQTRFERTHTSDLLTEMRGRFL